MKGTILFRANAKRGKIGSVVQHNGKKIWCYMDAAIFEAADTMAMNLAGLDYFIREGGDLIWHQVDGKELWYETDVETVLAEGFIGTFSPKKQEERMNLHLDHWRRIRRPGFDPYVRYSEGQVVILRDLTRNEFLKKHSSKPAVEQMRMFA